jgi:hypothetical protein
MICKFLIAHSNNFPSTAELEIFYQYATTDGIRSSLYSDVYLTAILGPMYTQLHCDNPDGY